MKAIKPQSIKHSACTQAEPEVRQVEGIWLVGLVKRAPAAAASAAANIMLSS